MSFAPRQNYHLYDAAVSDRKLELCRAASPSERFRRYADYFDTVAEATALRESSRVMRERRLRDKIVTQKVLICVFQQRDKWIREERTPNHTD